MFAIALPLLLSGDKRCELFGNDTVHEDLFRLVWSTFKPKKASKGHSSPKTP
jgi:hypothetical protein